MDTRTGWRILAAVCVLGLPWGGVGASDHDDGENDLKARALNFTDLFVFRESDQTGNAADDENLILIMNVNPRSLPGQQYYFSTQARYDFRISRRHDVNDPVTGASDVRIGFRFGPPDENRRQRIFVAARVDRTHLTSREEHLRTTPLGTPEDGLGANDISLGGARMTVFAGHREDPFFFDVVQFFKVRAGAAGFGPPAGFNPPESAMDFTTGYNVLSIVVRVPISLLSGSTGAKVFDVWETLGYPVDVDGLPNQADVADKQLKQIERLARPVINEGLVISNAFLNAFNAIPPAADLSLAAEPVRQEAVQTLLAFGNSPERAGEIAQAFLPDVMRIDTSIESPVGTAAYPNQATPVGTRGVVRPVAGRKIEDDVVDITLGVLTQGVITTDNVSYEGVAGNPSQPGHRLLHGQTTRRGAATFPFLAEPR